MANICGYSENITNNDINQPNIFIVEKLKEQELQIKEDKLKELELNIKKKIYN